MSLNLIFFKICRFLPETANSYHQIFWSPRPCTFGAAFSRSSQFLYSLFSGDDKLTSDLGDIMIAQAAAEIAGKTQLMTRIEEKMCDTIDRGGSPEMPGLSASAPVTMGPLSMEMSIDDISLTWSDFSGQQEMLSPDGDGFESFLRSVTGGDHDKPMKTHVTSPSKHSFHNVGSPLQSGSLTSLERLRLHPGGSYQKLPRSPSDDIFPMEITETIDDNDQHNGLDGTVLTAKSQAQNNVRVRSYSSSAWTEKEDITDHSKGNLPQEKTVSPLSRHLSLPSDIERSLENMVDEDFGSDALSSCTPSDADRTLAKSLDEQNRIQVTAIVHDEGVAVDTPSPMEEPRYDNRIPGADSGLSHTSEILQNSNGTTSERESQAIEQRTTSNLDSAFGSHVTDSGYAPSLPTHLVPFTPDTDTEIDIESEKSKLALNLGEGILDSIGSQIESDLSEMESRPVRKSRSYEKAISSGEGLDYEFSDNESSKRASMLEDVEEVSENSSSTVTDVCGETDRLNSGKVFVKERSSKTSVGNKEIIIDYPPLHGEARENQDESTIVGEKAKSEYVECKSASVHIVERRLSSGKDVAPRCTIARKPEGEAPVSADRKDSFELTFEQTLDSLSPRDDHFSLEMTDFIPPSKQGIRIDMNVGESDVDNMQSTQPASVAAKKPVEKLKSIDIEMVRSTLERKGSKMSCTTPSSISPDPMSIHLVDEICEIYEQTKRQSGLFDAKNEETAQPNESPEQDFTILPEKPGVRSPVHEVRVLVAGKLSSEYSPPEEVPALEVEPISEETSTVESTLESTVEEDSTTPELAVVIPDEDTTASLELESPIDDLEPFAVEVRPEDLGQLEESGLNLEVSMETNTLLETEHEPKLDMVDADYTEQLEESLDMLEETGDRWRRSGSQDVATKVESVVAHRLSAELDQMLVEKREDEVALEKIIQTIEHAETVLDEAASQMVSEEDDDFSVSTEQTELPGSPSPEISELETPTLERDFTRMKGSITALIEPDGTSLTTSFDSFELDAPVVPSETTSTIPSPEIFAPTAEPEVSLTPSPESPEVGTPTKEVYEVNPELSTLEHEDEPEKPEPTCESPEPSESPKPSDIQSMLNKTDIMSTSLPPMHLEYGHHDNKVMSAHEIKKPEPEFVKDVEVRSESLPRKSRLPQAQEESKLPLPMKTPPSVPKRSRSPASIVNQVDWISRERAKSKEKDIPPKVETSAKFGFRDMTGSENGERRLSRSRLSWEQSPDPEQVSKPSWQKSPEPEKVTRPSWKESPEPEKVTRPSWQKPPSPEPVQEPKVQQRSPEDKSPHEKSDEAVHPEWKPREAIRLSSSRFKNVKPLFSCLDPEEHESLASLITSPPPGSVAPQSFSDTTAVHDESDEVFLPKEKQSAEKPYRITTSDILAKYSDDSVSPSTGRRDSGSRRPLSRGSFDSERQTPSPSKRVEEPYSPRKLMQPGWSTKREEKAKAPEPQLSIDTGSADTSHQPEALSPKEGFKPREKMQLSSSRFQNVSSSVTTVTLDKLREPKILKQDEKEEKAQARLSSGSLMSASYPADPATSGVARIRRSKSSASDESLGIADVPTSDWKGKKSQSFGQDSEPVAMETSRLPRLGNKDCSSRSRPDHAHNALHAKQLKTAEKLFIDESKLESDVTATKSQDAQSEIPEKKPVGVKRKKSVRELLSKFESGAEGEGEQSEATTAVEEFPEDKHRAVPAVFQKPKIIRLRSLSPSKDSLVLSSKRSPEIIDKKDDDHEVAMDTSPKFRRSSPGESNLGVQGRQRSPRLSPLSDSDLDAAKHSTEKVSPKLRPKPSPSEIEAAKSRNRANESENVDITDSDKSPNSIRNRLKYFDSSSPETSKISPDFSRLRRTSKDGEEKDADLSKSKIAKPSAKFTSRSQSQQFENDQKDDVATQAHFRRKSDMSDKDSIYASHDKQQHESDGDSTEFKSRLQQPQIRSDSRMNKTSSHESVSSSGSRGSNRSLGENEADSVQNAKEKFDLRRMKPIYTQGEESKRDSSNSWSSRHVSGEGLPGQRKSSGQSENTRVPMVTDTQQQKKSPEEKPGAAMFGVKLRKTKRLDPEAAS
jgi:hypothetical protein